MAGPASSPTAGGVGAPAPASPAAPAPTPAVTLRGALDDLAVFEVLQLLAATSQSGVLRVSGAFPAEVHLAAGRIGAVRLRDLPPVTDALVQRGLAAPSRNGGGDDVAAAVASSGDPDRCRVVVQEYVLEALFELSVLGEGSFEFVSGVADPWAGTATVAVAEAAADHDRRLEEWREVADAIPSMRATPALVPELPTGVDRVELSWAEWRVLGAVDGRVAVSAVVAASGLAPLEACRSLHHLVAKGLVAVHPS